MPDRTPDRPDLRALVLGSAAWCGALVVLLLPGRLALALVAALVIAAGGLVLRLRGAAGWWAPVAALVAVAGVAALQQQAVATSPVAGLADEHAVASLRLEITSDTRVLDGRHGELRVARARVTRVDGRGAAWTLRTPVVVMGDEDWPRLPLGSTVRVTGRLLPDDEGAAAALVRPTGAPEVLADPGPWWDAAAAVRRSVRAAVGARDPDARELVPALVVGDDGGLDPDLADDFRTTGLTHLLAVSGTNLTLVVGSLLVLARLLGARGARSTCSPRPGSRASC